MKPVSTPPRLAKARVHLSTRARLAISFYSARPLYSSLIFGWQPKRDKFSGLSRRLKRRKLGQEEDEAAGDHKAVNAAIRSAKKAARPNKIGVPEKRDSKGGKSRDKKSKSKPKVTKGGNFGSDLGQRGGAGKVTNEGIRAKKGDAIGGMKKGGKGAGGKRKGK